MTPTDEQVEAGAKALYGAVVQTLPLRWEALPMGEKTMYRRWATAVLEAAALTTQAEILRLVATAADLENDLEVARERIAELEAENYGPLPT